MIKIISKCVYNHSCENCKAKIACFSKVFNPCQNCSKNYLERNSDATILKFIKTFDGSQNIFLNGNCYWFAFILKNRFEGTILYSEKECHFICKIREDLYDVRGNVSKIYESDHLIKWEDMLFVDPNEYQRLFRDCVLKF